jgi:hypothetical protein
MIHLLLKPVVSLSCRHHGIYLVFEGHAFRVVHVKPSLRGCLAVEDFEMVTVTNLLAGVDIDPDHHARALAAAFEGAAGHACRSVRWPERHEVQEHRHRSRSADQQDDIFSGKLHEFQRSGQTHVPRVWFQIMDSETVPTGSRRPTLTNPGSFTRCSPLRVCTTSLVFFQISLTVAVGFSIRLRFGYPQCAGCPETHQAMWWGHLARLGQLDHPHRRRRTTLTTRPALQRGLKLPDRRIPAAGGYLLPAGSPVSCSDCIRPRASLVRR